MRRAIPFEEYFESSGELFRLFSSVSLQSHHQATMLNRFAKSHLRGPRNSYLFYISLNEMEFQRLFSFYKAFQE